MPTYHLLAAMERLREQIRIAKLNAYEHAKHLALGRVDYRSAGYSKCANAHEAAGQAIADAAQRIKAMIQKWERENPDR